MMAKKILAVIILSFFFQLIYAQEKKIYIANHQVECQGVGKMMCMLYREAANEDWKNFYGAIEGFRYSPGYDYTLQVELSTISNPPADGSSVRYKLKKIISKKPTMVISSEDRKWLDKKKWVLVSMLQNGKMENLAPNKASIQMDLAENKFSGNTGCNNMFGQVLINNDKINFSGIGSTLMACAGENPEKNFMTLLPGVTRFVRQDFTLNLYKGKTLVIVFELLKQPKTSGK